ncbi:MAG: LytTR family DNA-binding domain-containing protein [Bacteroidota bacterium]
MNRETKALNRLRASHAKSNQPGDAPKVDLDNLARVLQQFDHKSPYPSMINIPSKSGSIYIKVENILRAAAEGSYCRIFTDCGKVHTLSNNLKSIEKQLNPQYFFRCHHSHLINLAKVKEVVTDMGTYVVMEDGSEVDISKRKKNDFFKAMQRFIYS